MSLTCVGCNLQYVTAKCGVGLQTMADFGPYQIYSADLLECPGCGHKIARPASTPIAEHFQTTFSGLQDQYARRQMLFLSWPSIGARLAATEASR